MNVHASRAEVETVIAHVHEHGHVATELPGKERIVFGENPPALRDFVVALPGVVDAIPVSKPYKHVSTEWHEGRTIVDVGGVRIGGDSFVVAAGPCAVESEEQLLAAAR